MPATKSFNITGLWSKTLKGGQVLLQAKISLEQLQQVIDDARDYGLNDAVIEVWTNKTPKSEKSPSHMLQLAEPFVPTKTEFPNNQRQREAFKAKDNFPF